MSRKFLFSSIRITWAYGYYGKTQGFQKMGNSVERKIILWQQSWFAFFQNLSHWSSLVPARSIFSLTEIDEL